MKLTPRTRYLVLSRQHDKPHPEIALLASVSHAITTWDARTRISPVWTVEGYSNEQGDKCHSLLKNGWLIFIGPISPASVKENCPAFANPSLREAITGMWLGIGAFNVVIETSKHECFTSIFEWASQTCPVEIWAIENGDVVSTQSSSTSKLISADTTDWKLELSRLVNEKDELGAVIHEYGTLIAASISRASYISSNIARDIQQANAAITTWLRDEDVPTADVIPVLINLNAALSRLSSQAFSGTSPILETESHYWIHSLLGTGTANLALRNLTYFIQQRLISKQICERIRELEENKNSVVFLPDNNFESFYNKDFLGDTPHPANRDPIIPSITYFSGRDGFKYKDITLSSPLGTITGCNSLRWSLLTLTHEICHSIVGSVIGLLVPNISDPTVIADMVHLTNQCTAPNNWLDAIKQYFLKSIVAFQASPSVGKQFPQKNYSVTEATLPPVIESNKHEIEEIMVHVLDFMYFYRRDVRKYVRSIWVSWSVIPNINHKIPEYVRRTLCAVLSTHIHKGIDANDSAKESVLESLKSINGNESGNNYVIEAINYINNKWDELSLALDARKPFVRIARVFIYSETFAAQLMSESAATSTKNKNSYYPFRTCEFTQDTIDNPLLFLESHTRNETSKESESVWMLNTLAYSIREQGA